MKKYLGFLLVLLTSCSGPSDQTEDLTEEIDTMEGNGLVEYDLDKNRLSAVEFNN